ncbi:hypothetical protein BBJ28_00019884 [Nothophytophthora sp. Chile5]|nr:hypothetical protein BBJ28_00019884 [Nothophytophthora sp. Chile5]
MEGGTNAVAFLLCCKLQVEVMYDGWPDDYDEVVRLDSHRVAPYHTYTWVVKCWVKYLNWPLWPSLNLAMEDRLYVDFLDSPEFLKRDRCKKRQVRMFDPNYDKNRKETNGEQFERALECVLQSDATTKMPTFVKGTLPVQYKNTPALSVRKMRKDMGNELWFKNFANNKDRHYQTHIYNLVGVDKGDDDAASEESVLVSKPKSKPKRKDLKDGKTDIKLEVQTSRSKKRKGPKIELEPGVEEAYELEEMNSSEESDRSETQVSVPAKKRLRSKARAEGEPLPTPIKAEAKEVNAASHMPRHVTVLLDDIIVDDDDDEDSSESARKKATKRTRKPTVQRSTSSSAPKQIIKESNGERRLLLSESKTSRRETAASGHRELAAKDIDGRARQKHVRRTKSKDAGELHRKAWTAIFSETADRFGSGGGTRGSFLQPQEEESDDSGFSESFDPGTTSEEKATSPFDARIGYGDGVVPSIPDIATRDKGEHQDDEDEEKGVPRAFMEDGMSSVDYSTKKGMARKLLTQLRSRKKRETPAEASVPKRTGPVKSTKGAMPLIEQRIADTQKAIQLDEEKRKAAEAVAAKERARAEKENSASSLLLFGSIKARGSEGRRPRQQRSELSLLARVASNQNVSSGWSELSAVRRVGRVQETAMNQPLQHDHMGHSFLSLEKPCSSDSPEAKDTRSAFEDDAAVVDDDLAVKVDATTSPAPEKTREKANRAERKETSMAADKEGVDPELGRPVCEMQVEMEGPGDVVAVCRLGFQVQTLSTGQLKVRNLRKPFLLCMALLALNVVLAVLTQAFCEEMEHPSLCLPLSDASHGVAGCLACEFFLGAHDRKVHFSALLGIQWDADPPSWELLRSVDPLSKSICEFYESTPPSTTQRSSGSSSDRGDSSPLKPNIRRAADKWTLQLYEQQNPRFPSVQSSFSRDKQWLYRSQLLAPDISPRYMDTAVPKSYRDGQFQPLLTTQQVDSVTRLNLSPRAPASLAEVRRQQPHLSLSTRSASPRRRGTKEISTAPTRPHDG